MPEWGSPADLRASEGDPGIAQLTRERDEARADVVRLRTALAEVMVPIEALAAPGEDAWDLAPEVRGELMTARTLGRAALGIVAP